MLKAGARSSVEESRHHDATTAEDETVVDGEQGSSEFRPSSHSRGWSSGTLLTADSPLTHYISAQTWSRSQPCDVAYFLPGAKINARADYEVRQVLPERLAYKASVSSTTPSLSPGLLLIYSSGVKKPLNPILGETFYSFWDYEDGTRGYYIAEQTSHHPPKSSYFFMAPEHHIRIDGTLKPRSKFLGNSAASMMEGLAVMRFTNRNER
ncbi:hypothetical protein MRB53_040857 [Persea americana]|nr:hypothetical protein MRB53_040857 [Persea americana]